MLRIPLLFGPQLHQRDQVQFIRTAAPLWLIAALLLWSQVLRAEDSPTGKRGGATEEDEQQKTDEVVVRGTRRPEALRSSERGIASYTVGRARLSQPGINVSEALREAPGVQITSSGGLGAPSTARLRGATAAQTPVYLGDIRINDEVGGVADLSTVPHYMIDRIEVYRGHAPGRMTQLGMGGAIVLVPRIARTSENALQAEVGSFGTRALRGRLGLVDGKRSLFVAGEVYGTENNYRFEDTRGTLFNDDDGGSSRLANADNQGQTIWIRASERLGQTRLSFIAHYAAREQGAPKLALVPSESARARFSRSLFAVSARIPQKNGSLSLSTRAILGRTELDDPAQELGLLRPHTETPGERIEQVFESRHDFSPHFWVGERLVVSLERLRRFERQGSEDLLAQSSKRLITRPSLQTDYQPWPGVHLDALTALNCVSTDESELELCQSATATGRIGARYEGSVWELYTSVGRYQRLATLSELYGTGVLVRGNDRLQTEHGISPELGVRVRWGRSGRGPALWSDASIFARYSRNLIVFVRTAQGYLHPINQDRSRTLGGEWVVGWSPLPQLKLEGNVSLLDARNTSPGRTVNNDLLPFVSPLTTHGRLSYHLNLPQSWSLSSTELAFVLHHQSSRYADPAGLGVIPDQTFGDLEWNATALHEQLQLNLRLSNLWNAQRYDVVGFPLPSRSVFFNAEIIW